MKAWRVALSIVGFLFLLIVGHVTAQTEETPPRTWIDRTGTHSVVAHFVGFADGQVTLRKENGAVISVPLENFRLADRQTIRALTTGGDTPRSAAKNLARDFAKLKPMVLRELASGQAPDRAKAIHQLRDYPTAEAVDILVHKGLVDKHESVRREARDLLMALRNHPEVCASLQSILVKRLNGSTRTEPIGPLVEVLIASDLPEAWLESTTKLDVLLAASKPGVLAISQLADRAATQGDHTALETLEKLTHLKCYAANFPLRRFVVQSIARIHLPETIDTLIRIFPEQRGEVRADIAKYLAAMTGKDFGINARDWSVWWKENRATFDFSREPIQSPEQTAEVTPIEQGTPMYYGMPVYGQRVLFVIDISGSMKGQRIANAKRELLNVIRFLPEDTYFSIISYNSTVRIWQRQLVPATQPMKMAAAEFVNRQEADQQTATYDALDAAFRFDVEAIYFLSDGAPTAGRIVDTKQILAAVTKTNRLRMVTLYVFGIAPAPPGGRFELFLRSLAEKNFGDYQRVD